MNKFVLLLLLYAQTTKDRSQPTIVYEFNKVHPSCSILGVDSLKVGKSYFINVKSNGCFHHSELSLVISKGTSGYFASFKMKGKVEGQNVKTKFKKTKLVNYQIDSVRNFERQLFCVSALKYNCTTVDDYSLSIDTSKKVYTVDNCDWHGIEKLIGVLFRKTK